MLWVKRSLVWLLLGCLLISVLTSCARKPLAQDAEIEGYHNVVTYAISPGEDVQPISPLIYGTNQDLSGFEDWTFRRLGGNRLSGYNWENNASNAGADWYHVNDGWLCDVIGVTMKDCLQNPAAVMSTYHDQSLAMGAETLITLQMAGYVSADFNNEVSEAETAPSPRWEELFSAKEASFENPPNREDGQVFMDELVFYLTSRYGSAADENGILAYSLDNEPALWSHTHPRIHPQPLEAAELVTRSIALAGAVKEVDPQALIFGPALYGFNAFRTLQDAPDWFNTQVKEGYDWFIDYYLAQMALAETAHDLRLLDVLDVHWYSEAQGNNQRITFGGGAGSEAVRYARMQAPRTFWDGGYREKSWIAQYFPTFLPLLPRLQTSIATYYPGTRLAFTEWGFGGENDVSGGIAAADVLGIFGKYGVFAASHWSTEEQSDYISAAYALYRNYDGNGGRFGQFSVKAESNDIDASTIYASFVDEDDQTIHVIVFNKSLDIPIEGQFMINADAEKFVSARVWGFDESSPVLREFPMVEKIKDNQFTYILPPLSAYHFIIEPGLASPVEGASTLEIILVSAAVLLIVGLAVTLRLRVKATLESIKKEKEGI